MIGSPRTGPSLSQVPVKSGSSQKLSSLLLGGVSFTAVFPLRSSLRSSKWVLGKHHLGHVTFYSESKSKTLVYETVQVPRSGVDLTFLPDVRMASNLPLPHGGSGAPVLRPPVPRKATAITGDAQPCLREAVATEWPVCARWVVGTGSPGERGAQALPQASAGPCAPRPGP